ncbi:hypothetical protein ANO11243_093960 [Dothideomycetidae sp. 11243]|nr:hypothetical protein ANO11243_093960 [fungal sp. No.11243]
MHIHRFSFLALGALAIGAIAAPAANRENGAEKSLHKTVEHAALAALVARADEAPKEGGEGDAAGSTEVDAPEDKAKTTYKKGDLYSKGYVTSWGKKKRIYWLVLELSKSGKPKTLAEGTKGDGDKYTFVKGGRKAAVRSK